ncbi:MAG: translation elongation factor-like protein [Candidatus Heimdallarchaeota archaeon]|nr:translation elongation factor-like protein [Candidatus Heimdallarchaeota archaeon]MCK4613128.1 translation elongation factor-like protein [Candidatus Heimdallarchaeota archaeon]
MKNQKVGEVFKFYVKPSVAAIDVLGEINIGDKLLFLGANTDFEMIVKSMQIESEEVKNVKKGQKVGFEVPERVRPNDEVFKISK